MTTPNDEEFARWLNDEERESFLTLMSVMIRLDAALDKQLRRDAGLSHYEYTVLSRLSEAEDRTLRMRELAATTNGSLSRLSQVVARLEAKGWLHRHPDPTDGRTTLATLSDAGWDKVVETAPGHVHEVRSLVVDPLTGAQVRQLTEIGQRILGAIDER